MIQGCFISNANLEQMKEENFGEQGRCDVIAVTEFRASDFTVKGLVTLAHLKRNRKPTIVVEKYELIATNQSTLNAQNLVKVSSRSFGCLLFFSIVVTPAVTKAIFQELLSVFH